MGTPLYNEVEWIALCESEYMPDIYVDVWNMKARIMKKKDVVLPTTMEILEKLREEGII